MPEGSPISIYPALTYRDVRAAITWLETAFGLEGHDLEGRGLDDGGGALGSAVLRHGDAWS